MKNVTESSAEPGRMARVLLVACALGTAYLDYFGYRAQGYYAAGFWSDRLRGDAPAPDQYRVGIVWLSHWVVVHTHLPLMWTLASLDLVSALVALLILFRVLECTAVYREAPVHERWFGAAAFVLLVLWFLAWLLWLQKPETLPAAMLVALLLRAWQGAATRGGAANLALALGLSLLLCTFRAEMACLLNLGICGWLLVTRRRAAGLPRGTVLAGSFTAAGAAIVALAVQVWLMHFVYPQASYGKVKLWQLWPNIKHATRWPPFAIFLLPLFWMCAQVVRRRFVADGASIAFLWGALCFAALWVTIGKIDEVRIFLPFALALTPLTVQMAMLRLRAVR